MKSTGRSRMVPGGLCLFWMALCAVPAARAADAALPCPPPLQPAVQFWVRVYTQIDTDAGFLHDASDLGVVYATVHFAAHSSRFARDRTVDRERDHLAAELRRIAAGARPLTAPERRIATLWGPHASAARLREAAHDIRFQLGQANRFKAGLIRSGAWQSAIAGALAARGLPPELAALPLVESSYNPRAYSKDGAAGLWQFMPGTARRFLRIGSSVDQRFDPFSATVAAAQLLAYDYRILGTWPLAITAYNQGVAGMLRAVHTVGTRNIATIVRRYHSPTFGFASRNFYASFLAALYVEQHAQRFFGVLRRLPEEHFQQVTLPDYVAVVALERALGVTAARLRELNPALLPPVWSGELDVPRGYRLRVPKGGSHWTVAALTARLGPQALRAAQLRPPVYRVRRGDTLSGIAARYRVSPWVLARFNGIALDGVLRAGERLRMPGTRSPHEPLVSVKPHAAHTLHRPSGSALTANTVDNAVTLSPATLRLASGARRTLTNGGLDAPIAPSPAARDPQPVSAPQAEALGPMLGPEGGAAGSTDPTDYSVASDGTIRVAAAESLGYYAEWLGVSAMDLRRINHLRFRQPVRIGERIRLDFRYVTPQQFETRRVAYHGALESSYFASHRIDGTRTYVTHTGDSLWTLTRRFAGLPAWLLRQYNPDTDFFALRPGTRLVIPRIVPDRIAG